MGLELLTVNTKSKQDIAYEQIKQLILENKLLPGTVMHEQKLSDMLEISRTPVRAALRDLANEGFITYVPGKGAVVSEIRVEDVVEIYELRENLDIFSFKLFLSRCKKEDISEMQLCIEKMKSALDAGELETFVGYDIAFHDCYLKNSGNSRLESIMATLHDQIRRFLNLTANDENMCINSYSDHRRVMDAVLEKDYEKATTLLLNHISFAKDYHIRKLIKL